MFTSKNSPLSALRIGDLDWVLPTPSHPTDRGTSELVNLGLTSTIPVYYEAVSKVGNDMKPDSRAESSEIGAHLHPRILGTAQLPQIEVPILVVET